MTKELDKKIHNLKDKVIIGFDEENEKLKAEIDRLKDENEEWNRVNKNLHKSVQDKDFVISLLKEKQREVAVGLLEFVWLNKYTDNNDACELFDLYLQSEAYKSIINP